MKAIPIAQYLSQQGKATAHGLAIRRDNLARATPAVVGPKVEEIEDAAYRRGRQDERARIQLELEAALAEQREALEQQMRTQAQEARAQEMGKVAEALEQGFAVIEADLVASVGRILRPFLDEALAQRCLDSLTKQITALLSSESAPVIRIRGPQPLLRDLQRRMPSLAAEIEFSATDGPEVVVLSDSTCLATPLSEWRACLEAVYAGAENG